MAQKPERATEVGLRSTFPTRIQGGTLQLFSIPEEQLRRIHLGDSVFVNGFTLRVDQISLEEKSLTFFIPIEIITKITLQGTSEVEFQRKVIFEDFP